MAQRACEAEAKEKACSFWWVSADALRECEDKTLPRFQELRKRAPGFLVKHKITRRDSVQSSYTQSFLTISHRWHAHAHPDSTGSQLKAIQTYLIAHGNIKWVWFECVPQSALPHSWIHRP